MKKLLYICIAFALVGCGFLDKEPDLRAEINTQKKVQLLLTSAYVMPNYGVLGEVMSDNTVDNNTADSYGKYNTKNPMSQMYHDYFRWQPVTSDSQQDSPYYIWNQCYSNIAVANQALNAIEKLESENKNLKLNAERAEALLIRAYNHFILVNIFCQAYKNDQLSKNDLGIHYMTKAETEVRPHYDRGTVTETYLKIQADLEEALAYVSDDYYSVPKYHFNTKAAYAFAAKFYLYKRDYTNCIKCANRVLGTTPAEAKAMMWDAATAKLQGNSELEAQCWIDAKSNANLLICTSMSVQVYAYIPDYARYTLNRNILECVVGKNGGPCWSGNFPGFNLWRYDANYGSFACKIKTFFEYTDKVAQIGFGHTMRRELTTNELLLTRAEAKIMTEDYAGAISDMDVWCQSYKTQGSMKTMTSDIALQYGRAYKSMYTITTTTPNLNPVAPQQHSSEMGFETPVAEGSQQEFYLNTCLHLRRIETLWDGNRLFDLKRYGMEICHNYNENGTDHVISLTTNDPHYAVQIPQEAILAGHQPNPGYNVVSAGSAPYVSPVAAYGMSLKYPLTIAQ